MNRTPQTPGRVRGRPKKATETSSPSTNISTSLQRSYENRYNCIVCWCPSLRMVYGRCQHKLCVDCCYDEQTNFVLIKNGRCPTCRKDFQFPMIKPVVPEDNIEHQRCLGICSCPNECGINLWQWEVEEHLQQCPKQSSPAIVFTPKSSTLQSNSLVSRGTHKRKVRDSPDVASLSPRRTRSMQKTPVSELSSQF